MIMRCEVGSVVEGEGEICVRGEGRGGGADERYQDARTLSIEKII